MSKLLPLFEATDEKNWSEKKSKKMLSTQHINYMLELDNTTQNSSEQITTLDYQTDIKDSRKEDLLL